MVMVNIGNVKGQNVFSNTYQNIDNQLININDLNRLSKGNYIIHVRNGREIINYWFTNIREIIVYCGKPARFSKFISVRINSKLVQLLKSP
jgi:hypothetical protein